MLLSAKDLVIYKSIRSVSTTPCAIQTSLAARETRGAR